MNAGWKKITLADVFDIGSSKRVHKRDWVDEGVPFYRAREIVKLAKQGYVDNELFISEELFEEFSLAKGAPREGDLMVTAVGTLGVCYEVKEHDRFYFKDASVLQFRPKGKVNSTFMEYAFLAPQIREQSTNHNGATVGTLTIDRAKSLEIELPPLREQKRIVAILDDVFERIDTAIANTEKNLANARELFESYLNNVFTQKGEGWVEKEIGECCKLKSEVPYR